MPTVLEQPPAMTILQPEGVHRLPPQQFQSSVQQDVGGTTQLMRRSQDEVEKSKMDGASTANDVQNGENWCFFNIVSLIYTIFFNQFESGLLLSDIKIMI